VPIAPVGSSYTPVGKVDINALRSGAATKPAPAAPATKPMSKLAAAQAGGVGSGAGITSPSLYARGVTVGKAPEDAWGAPTVTKAEPTPAAAPPPPPAAARPPVVTAARPAPAATAVSLDVYLPYTTSILIDITTGSGVRLECSNETRRR
jgi:drebrin-like protein